MSSKHSVHAILTKSSSLKESYSIQIQPQYTEIFKWRILPKKISKLTSSIIKYNIQIQYFNWYLKIRLYLKTVIKIR